MLYKMINQIISPLLQPQGPIKMPRKYRRIPPRQVKTSVVVSKFKPVERYRKNLTSCKRIAV